MTVLWAVSGGPQKVEETAIFFPGCYTDLWYLFSFMFLDSYFLFPASWHVVQHVKHVSSSEEVWWTREIRDTTGMLGCLKGSTFGHFSSSGSSETCRNLGNEQVYVHCTLIKLWWMRKVLLLFIHPSTLYILWDKLFLSRIWVQPLDSWRCMSVPGGRWGGGNTVLCTGIGVGIFKEWWLCPRLTQAVQP